MNLKTKRILAYSVDLFIISLLVWMISSINVLNPNKDKYQKVYNEYVEYYEANLSNTTIVPEDLINDEYAGYMHDLSYYSVSSIVIEVLVIILYFTLFPRFNNDQTVGKRLFKIKVISDNHKRVPIWKYLIRALLIPIFANVLLYNSVATILNVGAIFIFKGIPYLYANLIITYAFNFYCYADILVSFVRKDNRSLHDILTRTRVVELC